MGTGTKKAIENGDMIKAAEIALDIARKQQDFENFGEITIDEEVNGRLSLSSEGNKYLSEGIQKNENDARKALFTIFAGHHGVDYLSEQTTSALKQTMIFCQSGIYLCGHAHLARYSRSVLQPVTEPKDLHQIQAGVMFHDTNDYAQYGFNQLTIKTDLSKIDIEVRSYYLSKTPSQELRWGEEDIFNQSWDLQDIQALNISDTVTGNTSKEEEIRNNMVNPAKDSDSSGLNDQESPRTIQQMLNKLKGK